jgi:APA family basic amino acid/polyamine antiporter
VRPAATVQNVFTLLKLMALAVLIAAGLAAGLPSPVGQAHAAPGALGAALVPVLYTYGGWQQTNFLAEEMVHPERDLPRALLLGVAIVVATYLLANLAYLQVLGPAGLAASTAPAADAMARVLGPAGGTLIAAGVAASTFGFLNLVILVTPRVLQTMAADGLFFPRLARLHPVHRTPAAAIVVQGSWASVLVLSGTFAQLVDYVAFADWVFFGLTVAGLFVYRARDRAAGRSDPPGVFRTPGYPWTPAAFVTAAIFVVASSVLAAPRNALIGTGILVLGVPVYRYWSRAGRRSAPLA